MVSADDRHGTVPYRICARFGAHVSILHSCWPHTHPPGHSHSSQCKADAQPARKQRATSSHGAGRVRCGSRWGAAASDLEVDHLGSGQRRAGCAGCKRLFGRDDGIVVRRSASNLSDASPEITLCWGLLVHSRERREDELHALVSGLYRDVCDCGGRLSGGRDHCLCGHLGDHVSDLHNSALACNRNQPLRNFPVNPIMARIGFAFTWVAIARGTRVGRTAVALKPHSFCRC